MSKRITKIVLTGGPAAGKTTLVSRILKEFKQEDGWRVITIPETAKIGKEKKIENIVVFTNLEQEDLLAIDTMARIFDRANAKITIVHAKERKRPFERSNRESIKNIIDFCRKNFPQFIFSDRDTLHDLGSDAASSMISLNSDKIDLIVIPNKRKNAFSRLFNPGLAHKLIVEADIPMLVIPV